MAASLLMLLTCASSLTVWCVKLGCVADVWYNGSPVHLGSMQYAITFAKDFYGNRLKDGDVIISNHPSAGGTHLPDITIISVFLDNLSGVSKLTGLVLSACL